MIKKRFFALLKDAYALKILKIAKFRCAVFASRARMGKNPNYKVQQCNKHTQINNTTDYI